MAYSWDKVKVFTGKSKALYKAFTNELDNLTYHQVNWWPYETDQGFELNEMCTRDKSIWRARVPLICVYAVEWYVPQRVATQLGRIQRTPLADTDTGGFDLHRRNRQTCQSVTNWAHEHKDYVTMWGRGGITKRGI